jgi:hypothetical protein
MMGAARLDKSAKAELFKLFGVLLVKEGRQIVESTETLVHSGTGADFVRRVWLGEAGTG